jgi:putative transposase
MAQLIESRSLRSLDPISCLPQNSSFQVLRVVHLPPDAGLAEDWKVGLVHIQPGRAMQNEHVESFHGRLRDECLNANWFRTLNDVRSTLAAWRQEYNCERPHSSLDYRTPEEFRAGLTLAMGYGDVESKERFPHPHSPDHDEIYSSPNQTRETPVING